MTLHTVIDPGAIPRRGTYGVAKVLSGLPLYGNRKAWFPVSSRDYCYIAEVLAGLPLDGKGKTSFPLSSRDYCYIAEVLAGLPLDGKGKASFPLSSRINENYTRSLIRAPLPGALVLDPGAPHGARRVSGSMDK